MTAVVDVVVLLERHDGETVIGIVACRDDGQRHLLYRHPPAPWTGGPATTSGATWAAGRLTPGSVPDTLAPLVDEAHERAAGSPTGRAA